MDRKVAEEVAVVQKERPVLALQAIPLPRVLPRHATSLVDRQLANNEIADSKLHVIHRGRLVHQDRYASPRHGTLPQNVLPSILTMFSFWVELYSI